ncbi:MAG: T9SS type A sorting domain-containing protein, partial [Candidatus Poribacteria bacterium]|nr:T9SS type A sorting domain-containing protein [Candidatus Poribacteria bacterium]
NVLRYKAESSKTRVVAVSLAGTQITITPRGVGSASVAVTASDGKLLVTQRISVQVTDVQVNDATDNFADAFNGTALQNPNWRWQNEPANWDVGETRDGFLHIESETNRNLWASDASHFLYQETDADAFDVETHFFSRWDTASGVNGLVVKSPADNNWVTIKFWSRDAGAKGQIQYQTRGRGLVADPAWQPEFGATELFLRLRKQGDTYTGWYKTHEADPWIEIGVANFPLTPPLQLGIYAGVAAGTGTLTVDYDYFRSTVDTGVLASPMLQIAAMETPTETTLLPNYPNPFNPETWIPYRLLSSSDVTVRIYAINGNLVRRLALGHQATGVYQSRSRAAYWDGKNEVGEPVASGVYFYTLTAGEFAATRKMLIRK